MAEQKKTLKLQPTASGGEPLIYEWPLVKTKHYDAAAEVIETIEMVMEQYAELRVVMQRHCNLSEIDRTSYDQMKQLCDKFNKAAKTISDLWRGATRPGQASVGVTDEELFLKKIVQKCYNRAVEDPSKLNHHYEAWSSETYGETTFHRCQKIIEELNIKPTDTFVDLGSGIGQVVVHVAGASKCRKAIGIEKADMPAKYANTFKTEYERWMKWHGKKYQPFELYHDDFLAPAFRELITRQSTILFVNNYAFTTELNDRIKKELLSDLPDGTRIVSTRAFCTVGERRVTERHMGDLSSIMNVKLMTPVPEPTSWTCNNVDYFLHTINRSKLERYFFSDKKHRSRSATASPDIVSSEEDQHRHHHHAKDTATLGAAATQALHKSKKHLSSSRTHSPSTSKSGSSRESSEKPTSSRGRASSKAPPVDTARSRKTSTASTPPAHAQQQQTFSAAGAGVGGAMVGSTITSGDYAPYGPTTRRQWNVWISEQERNKKDKQKHKQHRSPSTKPVQSQSQPPVAPPSSVDIKPPTATATTSGSSRESSENLQPRTERSKPTSKIGRPRKSPVLGKGRRVSTSRLAGGTAAKHRKMMKRTLSVAAAASSQGTDASSSPTSVVSPAVSPKHVSPKKITADAVAGLDAMHEMTKYAPVVVSDKDVHVSDLSSSTATAAVPAPNATTTNVPVPVSATTTTVPPTTAQVAPPVAPPIGPINRDDQHRVVSYKYPELNAFLAKVRLDYEKTLDEMSQKRDFLVSLREAIDGEMQRKEQLSRREEHLTRQVKQLQDDGVRLLKERLNELNIIAETPSDLMHQSKEIVMRHKELRSNFAMLECEVDLLQQQNQKLVRRKLMQSRERDEQAVRSGVMQSLGVPLSESMTVEQTREYLVREIGLNLNRHQALVSEIVRMEQEVNALQSNLPSGLANVSAQQQQQVGAQSTTIDLHQTTATGPGTSTTSATATAAVGSSSHQRRRARAHRAAAGGGGVSGTTTTGGTATVARKRGVISSVATGVPIPQRTDGSQTAEEIEKQIQSIVQKALSVDSAAKSAEKERKLKSAERRSRKQAAAAAAAASTIGGGSKSAGDASSVSATVSAVVEQAAKEAGGATATTTDLTAQPPPTFSSAGLVPVFPATAASTQSTDDGAKEETADEDEDKTAAATTRQRQQSGTSAETESAPPSPQPDTDEPEPPTAAPTTTATAAATTTTQPTVTTTVSLTTTTTSSNLTKLPSPPANAEPHTSTASLPGFPEGYAPTNGTTLRTGTTEGSRPASVPSTSFSVASIVRTAAAAANTDNP